MSIPFIFDIKVVPNSGRVAWVTDKRGGQLKCYLKSPSERGRANKKLIKLLAKALRITQNNITIIFGVTGRKKRIRIEQKMTFAILFTAFGIDWQLEMFK